MNKTDITPADIDIRSNLMPGDLSYISYHQAKLYYEEYNYGIGFESYLLKGLYEFYENYDTQKDRVWICEHNDKIIGFLLLMHRGSDTSQLRYFYIDAAYRGIGLGKKLMQLYLRFHQEKGYKSSFLWTTHELDSAISLYTKYGFRLTEERKSTAFGKPVTEQRYDL